MELAIAVLIQQGTDFVDRVAAHRERFLHDQLGLVGYLLQRVVFG